MVRPLVVPVSKGIIAAVSFLGEKLSTLRDVKRAT